MNNSEIAHAAVERLAASLIAAGFEPRDVAEAMVTTGLAFMAADHPEAAILLTSDFYEVTDGQ
jgi:hypothetical protein